MNKINIYALFGTPFTKRSIDNANRDMDKLKYIKMFPIFANGGLSSDVNLEAIETSLVPDLM